MPAPTTCPRTVDQRLGEIETAHGGVRKSAGPLSIRPTSPAPASLSASIATAHCVSIAASSGPRTRRRSNRFRPARDETAEPSQHGRSLVQRAVITIGGAPSASETETPEEDDTIRPLSDRLVIELTAHRTLALRDAWRTTRRWRSRPCCTRSASMPSTASPPAPAWRSRRSSLASRHRRPAWPRPLPPRRSTPVTRIGPSSCLKPRPISGTR